MGFLFLFLKFRLMILDQNMDRFLADKVTEEVINSTECALDDSVHVTEVHDGRLKVELSYCSDRLSILFFLQDPLDFLITSSPDLLTMDHLDDEDLPELSVMGVTDVTKWIVGHLKARLNTLLNMRKKKS